MRWLLVAATLFGTGGCLSVDTPDGSLRCADTDMHPGRACPEGFHCAADSRCYRGYEPPADMSKAGCATLLSCELGCIAQTCTDHCIAAASDNAVTLWNPVIQCALTYCGGSTQADCNADSRCQLCLFNTLQAGRAGGGACWNQIAPCLAIGNQ